MERWVYSLIMFVALGCEPEPDAGVPDEQPGPGGIAPQAGAADMPAFGGMIVSAGNPENAPRAGTPTAQDPPVQPAPRAGESAEPETAGIPLNESCALRADGEVVSLGPLGECQYSDECVQSGTRTRTNQVCKNGQETAVEDTQAYDDCNRTTGDVILEVGEYGQCQYADVCDQQGTRSRTNRACSQGMPANRVETMDFPDCIRNTDGLSIDEAVIGPCTYTDACTLVGTRTETSTVCEGGRRTSRETIGPSDECTRETDGLVLLTGQYGPCTYEDSCTKTGVQIRTKTVCSGGRAVSEDENDEANCQRETDGVLLGSGEFGACEGFDDLCDLTGIHTRIDLVCDDGVAAEQSVTEACERAATGVAVEDNAVSTCIDVQGGTLILGDAEFIVPENAVAETTVMTLRSNGRIDHTGYEAYSATYTIETDGGVLDRPAMITLPYEGDATRAVLYWKKADERAFQRINGTSNGTLFTASVEQAGVGFVGDGINFRPPPDRTCARLNTLEGRLERPGIVALWLTADDCHGEPHVGLRDDEFVIAENQVGLATTEPRAQLSQGGLQVFVTVLLNVATSAQTYRAELKQAVAGFAESLLVERNVPAQIAIELFAGGDGSDPDNFVHSQTWQTHTSDLVGFTERLNLIGTYEAPQPEQVNVHGALTATAAKLEEVSTAFRQRNRGGALTLEYLILFSDSRDTANLMDLASTKTALAAHSTTVMSVGVRGPDYDENAMGELTTDLKLDIHSVDGLRREFLTMASRIETRIAGTYALAYCTPSRTDMTSVDVRLMDAMNEETAVYTFDGRGLLGCDGLSDITERCGVTSCGGLGCGICDDRSGSCNDVNQCQSYCETHPPTSDVPIANRCTVPNPNGYIQYCEQSISTLCDETCRDLTTDPVHCGACGQTCGENSVGFVDGEPTFGVTCVRGACVCSPGWHGPQCETSQCGDGVKTADEQCDDGNDSNGDLCATTCRVLSTAACAQQCDFEGTHFLAPNAQTAEPNGDDGEPGDYFGYSVAISGDDTIVGAHEDDANGVGSGSAYVFSRTDGRWAQVAKLTAEDGGAGDRFGWSVSIDSGVAAIGARHADDQGPRSGAAYVISRRDGEWGQRAKLLANDGAANDEFGWSIAISEETVLVGAPGDGDRGNRSGAVYVFSNTDTGWQQTAKLTPDDGEGHDHFGYSVALADSVAVVGAYGDDTLGSASGAAYIFTLGDAGWTQTTKLTAVDGSDDDWFGFSVSISSNTVIVGARNDDDRGDNQGSAYVFTLADGLWTQTDHLFADGESNQFGTTVAVSDDYAIIGAGVGQPSYVFTRNNGRWTQTTILSPDEGGEAFRRAVDVAGDTALLGTTFVQWPAPRCTDDGACFCRDGASGSDCAGRPVCGDGTLNDAEMCDDGNRNPGDGCDERCQLED